MSEMNRRSFLQALGSLVPAAALSEPAAAQGASEPAPLDEALLHALAAAVLPGELGAEGVRRAAARFQEWLAGYQPVAELNHGYGTGELEYTAADPGPGWAAQLRALDRLAHRRHARGFADLPVEQRRALVGAELARDPLDRMPEIAQARHVAVGLLAHWSASPEANDLCYRANIGRHQCRPLALSPERPTSLSGD